MVLEYHALFADLPSLDPAIYGYDRALMALGKCLQASGSRYEELEVWVTEVLPHSCKG